MLTTLPVRPRRGSYARRRYLLSKGNHKLGRAIFQWSLPPIDTCPGRTPICSLLCYATRHRYCGPSVKSALQYSYLASQKQNFTNQMVIELFTRRIKVVRVHAAGDFYSAEYAEKWLHIMRSCPYVQFFFYTRSWRISAIAAVIREMAELPNVRAFYSIDKHTARPKNVPDDVRLAYLATEIDETPPEYTDLVFLDHDVRGKVPKYLGGALCCPAETVGVQCVRCRLCLDPLDVKDPRRLQRRG